MADLKIVYNYHGLIIAEMPSDTNPDDFYYTILDTEDPDVMGCGCPSYAITRRPCKHFRRLTAYLSQQGLLPRPEQVPQNR